MNACVCNSHYHTMLEGRAFPQGGFILCIKSLNNMYPLGDPILLFQMCPKKIFRDVSNDLALKTLIPALFRMAKQKTAKLKNNRNVQQRGMTK